MDIHFNVPCPTEGKDQDHSPHNPRAATSVPQSNAQSVPPPLATLGPKVPTGTNCAHLGCP